MQVGHETTYGAIGNHHLFTKTSHCHQALPKLLSLSGFTEALNTFGRSDDDMVHTWFHAQLPQTFLNGN